MCRGAIAGAVVNKPFPGCMPPLPLSRTPNIPLAPSATAAEGLLISRHALRDHLLSTVYEALTAAASRGEDMEGGAPGPLSGEAEARPAPAPAPRRLRARGPAPPLPRRAAQRRWRARLQAQRSGSLGEVLIEAT